ncbi:MAG: DUF3857 domain-containing protein [Porticoccaceae bacterium]|nr:DUF3857 domain-containing protein [Pseudomonadales bacterium]MCP5173280.1 DUF3857 domain-containing protein [Pseudomonadales bacterium]
MFIRFFLFFFLAYLYCHSCIANQRLAPELKDQTTVTGATGANILYSIQKSRLEENGTWIRERYYSIQINDLIAARDYGRINVSFNHYYANAEIDFANVLNSKGELKAVQPDAIQIKALSGTNFYDEKSEMVFSLPEVEPGSIIEFQFRTETKKVAIDTVYSDLSTPHWFQRRAADNGWRADPVVNYQYQLTTPSSIEMKHQLFGGLNVAPKSTVSKQYSVKSWTVKNIDGVAIEDFMPPFSEVYLAIKSSNTKDWQKVDSWFWKKVEGKLGSTAELEKVIKQLKSVENGNDITKIRAVYEYLENNVRYISAHLGRGGYDPHSPNETLHNGYGDCKDQTTLALALLKGLGVEAYPVLVQTPASGKSDTGLVDVFFDHVMVWIPATSEHQEIWMDSTGDRALFPGVSKYLSGQPAFIVDGAGGELRNIEQKDTENTGHIDLVYRVIGSQIIAEVSVSHSGIFEEFTRNWWQRSTNRNTELKQLLSTIFEDNGQYSLTAEVNNADNIFNPVEIVARFSFDELDDPEELIRLGASASQLLSFFGANRGMQTPESRINRYINPYNITLSMNVRFEAPENRVTAVVASAEGAGKGYFLIEQEGFYDASDYVVKVKYTRPKLDLSVKEYENFYNSTVKIPELGGWVVALQFDKVRNEEEVLEDVKRAHGDNSFVYLLGLARYQINIGEFNRALKPAEKAVKMDSNSAEAWYTLGVVQGFSGDLEESEKSFEKAKRLGYEF